MAREGGGGGLEAVGMVVVEGKEVFESPIVLNQEYISCRPNKGKQHVGAQTRYPGC